jgi:uncharacterized protein YjbJ (UPF0337 family)
MKAVWSGSDAFRCGRHQRWLQSAEKHPWLETAPKVLHRSCPRRFNKENTMLNSTKQDLEGKLRETKGSAKQELGEATNDPQLESEGRTEKVAGIVQKALGKVEKVLGK